MSISNMFSESLENCNSFFSIEPSIFLISLYWISCEALNSFSSFSFSSVNLINSKIISFLKSLTKVEKDFYFTINNFLNENELTFFDEVIKNKQFIPVGIDGYKENYVENNTIGSYRLSFYSEQLAQDIFHRIKSYLNSIYKFDNKCYKYEPIQTKCNNNKKIVDFA